MKKKYIQTKTKGAATLKDNECEMKALNEPWDLAQTQSKSREK